MPLKNSQKQYDLWLPFVVALAAAIGLLAGYNMNFSNAGSSMLSLSEKGSQQDGRIEEILRFIETNYVDSLDQEQITVDAIQHILKQLDPHSNYITPEELNDHNEKMEGEYKGVGIETIKLRDTFYLTKIIKDSPADNADLQVGDAIIEIEGQLLSGNKSEFGDMRQYFNGDKNKQTIDLKCLSIDGSERIIEGLKPDKIQLASANQAYLIDDDIAYIKLERFSSNTYKQFMSSLEEMAADKAKLNLIIDLRSNPGGYLPQAINILSQLFKEKGNLLTFTEGLNRKKSDYRSTGKTFYDINKIVVLINKYSASGSEILAGAIQDWDRGIVLGEATYGKGLVQEILPLTNGGALRLTVAKYYTPSGRLIQKSYGSNNNNFDADTTSYLTKLLNRKVSGGGGVKPDYELKDPFTETCIQYSEYLDFYIMDVMKAQLSNQLKPSDFSVRAYNQFIKSNYGGEIEKLEEACEMNMLFYMDARYKRMVEGELAYKKYVNAEDNYIRKALDLITDKKSTIALLSNN